MVNENACFGDSFCSSGSNVILFHLFPNAVSHLDADERGRCIGETENGQDEIRRIMLNALPKCPVGIERAEVFNA